MAQLEQLDFSEAEIEAQLKALGYTGVPARCLRNFKRDLDQLILHERSSTDHTWGHEDSSSPSQLHSRTSPRHAEQYDAAFIRRQVSSAGQLSGQVHAGVLYSQMPHCPSAEDDDGNDPEQPEESDHYTRYSAAPSTGMLRSGGIGTESRHSLSSPSPERERAASRSLVFKRKFVRKQSARSPVCNESTRTEEHVSQLEEQLERLQVSVDLDSELHSESDGVPSWDAALSSGCPHRDTYRSHHRNDIPTQPKSFIHPQFHHPHSKNWKKTDPVTRYFQYRQHWDMFKVPGENKWMELRREIREQMTYSSQPLPNVKRTSRTVPKTSVVPTEKKRLALRWKVRHDLANGIMPAKFTYPF
ncbi:hydrolethalus syndrome protein 1 [Scleropages formosus]|uniref:Centriolar and ciliogenesis-associated protein HYLS1 C-terminal domain-containing protein n=1 Tax=Scleropages formosus TaxID=113540 RepID=A0A8C9R4D9_SCLFO|nr:hydrolethalus syndrome protein 1 [Scleropages formosus]XP_018581638.1 hydrolethalus syndrome protein 1 [Scleropages formosus]